MTARLVIITGLSGAGRTEALRAFEDMGYFSVDNLPPGLLPKFAELVHKSPEIKGAALVMDIRGGVFFGELRSALKGVAARGVPYVLVFLEAEEETLIRRYKQTRRRHPWEGEERLLSAIRRERRALAELRGEADVIIDTTTLSVAEFRRRLMARFALGEGDSPPAFRVHLVSFGFKYGLPKDADLVFDVRFLPNPFYLPQLRPLTGNDPPVRDYVLGNPLGRDTLERLGRLLEFLLPHYQREGKPQVTVAVGCTGGQHRSVVFANALAERVAAGGMAVSVDHRDLDRAEEE
ncbi:GTPase possibly involved in regulator sRNA degradation [Candidatus Hydrogenisulfobacillus filiaventi]|uniref:GTPase possibly involved in regulator sRNA degradation n=1 Tax=Candidatus Hydrogenisulfobacillus filiaventi TaxID=2707344 RepID=A0A6F8ZHI8_9FIRM|nr:RNase adapter RapZ [Bacillota bacterium]CAB1129347.1 GTPase possibly involved in regulator sRNA degradation [Candidatus Hydrogenisulfobacillus filiaventi]